MAENVSFKVVWNMDQKKKLESIPSKTMYAAARMTLDYAYPMIPLSNQKNSGKLRSTSMSGGVRQDGNNTYYIGSFTNYANRVYNLPDKSNWSTPGTSSEWYLKTWNKKQTTIQKQAIEEGKR